ncbi:MAG TPA: hypothetical protein VMF06_10445 [Candidatus Limnocylindria bacterium]|jgi:hypothetical protein|nr:hypothetical protein [Candidatus Limnocylindria bacterium]
MPNKIKTSSAKLRIAVLTAASALYGCASDPLMSGKPEDWVGHPASELAAAWGQPSRVLPEHTGMEVWEYEKSGELVSPKQNDTSFHAAGADWNGGFGAHGGITSTETREHLSQYQNLCRFKIKDGRIKEWYAARLIDGKIVWQDH